MNNGANITRIVFNPLLSTKSDVRSYLRTQTPGTAHPFNKVLQVYTGSGNEDDAFTEVDLTDKPASYFTDATSLNTVGSLLYTRMMAHSQNLAEESTYTVVSSTESFVDIPLVPGKIAFFALSLFSQPTYYDLAVGTSRAEILCYNSHTIPGLQGLWHSGDKRGGTVLLHSLQMEKNLCDNEPFVVFVSGYTSQHLHRYAAQNPAVLIVNHDTRTLYLVPVPLDRASIGDATVCCSAVGRRLGDKIRFTFLPNPPTCLQIHAGSSRLPRAQTAINAAITMSRDILRKCEERRHETQLERRPVQASATDRPDTENSKDGDFAISRVSTVAIMEKGTRLPDEFASATSHKLWFGSGLEVAFPENLENIGNKETEETQEVRRGDSDEVILPCCLGNVLEGPKLLALGKPAVGSCSSGYLATMFKQCKLAIIVVSDVMSDQSRMLNAHERINGLFIVQPEKTYSVAILDKKAAREEYFLDLSVNAVTALAGPQSIIVVQLAENYFFYRGIRWPGVFDTLPEFGADVTDQVHALSNDTDSRSETFPWPTRVNISSTGEVYFLGNQVHVDDISTTFSTMSFATIQEKRADIQDILTQLQTILSVEEVNRFASRLIDTMKKRIQDVVQPVQKPYIDFMVSNFSQKASLTPEQVQRKDMEKTKLHSAYRLAEREALEACQWLIDGLGNLVSTRTSSTKKHDLNQLLRKSKVANNVEDAKNMTLQDVFTVLQNECRTVGVITGNIDNAVFEKMLDAVAKGTLLAAVNSEPLSTMRVSGTATLRSSAEVEAILPIVTSRHNGPLASSDSSSICWAFPQSAPTGDFNQSAIPWPCFDRFVNLQDPADAYWPEVCMDSDIAKLRILTRGTLAAAPKSKRLNITPATRDLGMFMVLALLDLMSDFTQGSASRGIITGSSGSLTDKLGLEFSDPNCQIMRGLFGQLFTIMASGGGKPVSMAWQLVLRNPKLQTPSKDEALIYSAICNLLPHTAWPMNAVKQNVRWLLVRIIREQITDPATEPMRKAILSMEKSAFHDNLQRRNMQLEFLQIAVEVIRALHDKLKLHETNETNENDKLTAEVKQIAARMLQRQPDNISEGDKRGGFREVLNYLNVLAKCGKTSDTHHAHVLQTCLNMYVKRSGRWKKAKNAVNEKAVATVKNNTGGGNGAREIALMISDDAKSTSKAWGGYPVKIQNWATYDLIIKEKSVSEESCGKVSSDAERSRIPWRVFTGEELPAKEVKSIVANVLGDVTETADDSGTIEATNITRTTAATVIVESLDKRLAHIQKSRQAVELAARLESLTVKDVSVMTDIPKESFNVFVTTAIDPEEAVARDKLQRILATLLEGWRNPVVAETNAVNLLAE